MSINAAMRGTSVLSAIGSLLVIWTYLYLFNKKKKSYSTLIYYISICNLFTAIGMMIGQPYDGTTACWFQAILTTVSDNLIDVYIDM